MYFGDVRVVEAFDPIEGLMIRRADLYYRKVQPVKVAADSDGLMEVADSLGDLVKQMATDIATQVRERLRCANIARALAEEAWAIYNGRAPETGDMNS